MATKTATIKLYVSELVYAIESTTHLVAEQKAGLGASPESVALIKAGSGGIVMDKILRSIGSATSMLKSKLSEYINKQDLKCSNRQLDETEAVVTIELNALPSNFNEAGTDAIGELCHQFIVNTALVDWFLATDTADAQHYKALSLENLNEIRQVINKRKRPERKPIPKPEEEAEEQKPITTESNEMPTV